MTISCSQKLLYQLQVHHLQCTYLQGQHNTSSMKKRILYMKLKGKQRKLKVSVQYMYYPTIRYWRKRPNRIKLQLPQTIHEWWQWTR